MGEWDQPNAARLTSGPTGGAYGFSPGNDRNSQTRPDEATDNR